MNQEVSFGGRSVLVLNPLALAVSKTLRYVDYDPREKDTKDLALLQQDPVRISEVVARMKAIPPRSPR